MYMCAYCFLCPFFSLRFFFSFTAFLSYCRFGCNQESDEAEAEALEAGRAAADNNRVDEVS